MARYNLHDSYDDPNEPPTWVKALGVLVLIGLALLVYWRGGGKHYGG